MQNIVLKIFTNMNGKALKSYISYVYNKKKREDKTWADYITDCEVAAFIIIVHLFSVINCS